MNTKELIFPKSGLGKSRRVIYAMVRMGSTTILTFSTLTSFYFYGEILGVDPVVNGASHSMGRFLMAIMGFLFGYYSDKFMLRSSQARKLFIMAGSISLSISFFMLYNPIVESLAGNTFLISIYLFVWVGLLGASYSALIVPYQAWMPELTIEDERPVVSFLQNIFNLIGDGVGAGLAVFLLEMYSYEKEAFYSSIGYLAFGQIFLYAIMLLVIKGKDNHYSDSLNISRDAKLVLRDKSFLAWEGARGLASASSAMFTAMAVSLVIDYFGLLKPINQPLIMLAIIMILVFIPIALKLGRKLRFIKFISYSLYILSIGLFLVVLTNFSELGLKPVVGAFSLVLIGIGLLGYWLFVYAVTANIIERSSRINKKILAGTYTGLDNINTSFWEGVGYFALGVSQKYFTFIENSWALIASAIVALNFLPLSKLEKSFYRDTEEE